MLAGDVPFKGDYDQAVAYGICNEEAERFDSTVPNGLMKMVNKCLCKSPEDRYKEFEDLIAGLDSFFDAKPKTRMIAAKSIYHSTLIIAISILIIFSIFYFYPRDEDEVSLKSLAVLPFINEKDDPETDYLGMSLADEIIGGLTYLQNITIRPYSSVRVYKDKTVSPISAGKDLNVDFILFGYHIKEENLIRLNVELVNVHENKIIWRDKIEEHAGNTFKLIDDISERIINRLKIKLTPRERNRMTVDVPNDALAYEYYLQSLSYDNSNKGNNVALELLLKSIQIDSSYAPAFSELGYRTRVKTQNFFAGRTGLERVEQYYFKALKLNNEHLHALIELSAIHTELGKHDTAMKYLKKVFEINPNYAFAHFRLSYIYRFVGLLKESEKSGKRALEIDSKNIRFRSIGATYKYQGMYQESLDAYGIDTSAFSVAHQGEVYFRMGNLRLAEKYLDKVIDNETDTYPEFLAKGILAYLKDEKEEGLQIIREWEEKDIYDSEILYTMAANYGLFGDTINCIRLLKKAIYGGFYNFPYMMRDSFLDPVREDAEFQRVLLLAKEKHEAFKQKYLPENF
jgi:TolB-like protein/Tfp pilus assembly protein PilF